MIAYLYYNRQTGITYFLSYKKRKNHKCTSSRANAVVFASSMVAALATISAPIRLSRSPWQPSECLPAKRATAPETSVAAEEAFSRKAEAFARLAAASSS